MLLRRCAILMLEPREKLEFELGLLAAGSTGLSHVVEWTAITPHAGERTVDGDEVLVLGALSPTEWVDREALTARHSAGTIDALLDKQLVVGEGTEADARDRMLRETYWSSVPAIMHYATRWNGVDTEAAERLFVETTRGTLLERLGAAPDAVRERTPPAARMKLPPTARTPLDGILDARVTCRNFDDGVELPLASFAAVLYRAYGARTVQDYAPGVQLLKKAAPSAGGLHATEAYVLARRVEGLDPGLYHYHPVDHALEPIRPLARAEAGDLARRLVATQSYFAGAHALVVPVARFRRTFWKYRNHAKAYRALVLDVGHLSQVMYLAATELGLGAFITAAVNEIDIEQAFGLDPLEEGPLAVTGLGVRGPVRNEVEFDPLNAVWPRS